jgi:beta-lactamase class A
MTTTFSPLRRKLLAAAAIAPGASLFALPASAAGDTKAAAGLRQLEAKHDGRIGLALLDAEGAPLLLHRADERFPMCSTFKMMLSACILQHSVADAALMTRHVDYDKGVLVPHSPIAEKHVGQGMSVRDLCAATMDYSDNAAANLLLDQIGGPAGLTAYARGLGDQAFYLVNGEGRLAPGAPGDKRDTTTPQAMAQSLRRLVLGDGLPAPQRQQLLDWMRANTTGDKRIRAAVPPTWLVADKTGGGEYGSTNDIAVLHRPDAAPLVLAIYFTQHRRNAPLRDEVVAAAARLVLAGIG